MAPHSNILAWRIPWTEEPGGLQSMGSQRAVHDGSYLACMHFSIHRYGSQGSVMLVQDRWTDGQMEWSAEPTNSLAHSEKFSAQQKITGTG